jgi:uncharacterized membrane protein YkvA (DUF1232 family)
VLLRRLIGDEQVPRRRKLVLLGLVAYLSMAIDLVPDSIPVAGQLDDVIVAALALQYALRSGGPDLLRRHWPGPEQSLEAVIRLADGRAGRGGQPRLEDGAAGNLAVTGRPPVLSRMASARQCISTDVGRRNILRWYRR